VEKVDLSKSNIQQKQDLGQSRFAGQRCLGASNAVRDIFTIDASR